LQGKDKQDLMKKKQNEFGCDTTITNLSTKKGWADGRDTMKHVCY